MTPQKCLIQKDRVILVVIGSKWIEKGCDALSWLFNSWTACCLWGWKWKSSCKICLGVLSDIPRAWECFIAEWVGLCWNASLTAVMFSGMHIVCFGPFHFIRTTDSVSCNCFTQEMIVLWGSIRLIAKFSIKAVLFGQQILFHITFHSKNMFTLHSAMTQNDCSTCSISYRWISWMPLTSCC